MFITLHDIQATKRPAVARRPSLPRFLRGAFSEPRGELTEEEVVELTWRHFRVRGSVSALPGERDHNFRLLCDDGAERVLKLAHPKESRGAGHLQVSALRHIAYTAPELPVPRVWPDGKGAFNPRVTAGGAVRHMRMMDFCEGIQLATARRSPRQTRALGRVVANLDYALRGFFHPAAGNVVAWDLKHLRRLTVLTPFIACEDRRSWLERLLRNYDEDFDRRLARLRAQVIHNDANSYNVIVSPTAPDHVVGLIDFGDIVHAPLVCELAILCAYHLGDGPDPFGAAEDVLAGYAARLPLEIDEIEIFLELVIGRCLATILITEWRAPQNPDQRDYILKNNASAWTRLEALVRLDRNKVVRDLRRLLAVS